MIWPGINVIPQEYFISLLKQEKLAPCIVFLTANQQVNDVVSTTLVGLNLSQLRRLFLFLNNIYMSMCVLCRLSYTGFTNW